jgi:hypothetical protein
VPEREYHKDTCKREAGYFFVAHPVVAAANTLYNGVITAESNDETSIIKSEAMSS